MERVHRDRLALPDSTDSLIAQCRALYPGMQSFEDFARKRGRKTDRKKEWNGVSITALATGKQ